MDRRTGPKTLPRPLTREVKILHVFGPMATIHCQTATSFVHLLPKIVAKTKQEFRAAFHQNR